jgi:predicted HNH restriction endonuclease
VCNLNFGNVYGEELAGYIHVHHLRPLSEIKGEYTVDPIKDLRPVCPNCHAVIHSRKPPYSVEDVQLMIEKMKVNAV